MEKQIPKLTGGEVDIPPITQDLLRKLIKKSTYLCLMAYGKVTFDLLESFLLTIPHKLEPQSAPKSGNGTFSEVIAASWEKAAKIPVQAAGTSITRLAAQTKWEDYIETRKFFESEIFTLAAKDRKILDETVTEWIDTLRSETLDKNIH